jgi:hypothetical protein
MNSVNNLTLCSFTIYFNIILPAIQDFTLLHSVQTDSGAHPASYRNVGRELLLQGSKAADHSPPTSTEVKKSGAIPPLPHMSS